MRIVIAFLIGIVIGFVVFAYTPIGQRYEIEFPLSGSRVSKYDKQTGQTYWVPNGMFFKYDKWTGQTYWTYMGKKDWVKFP